ncbi:fatty acid-binding protein, intestinal-like [Anneissia japonica]|uniref:fatty acid-binding protein, intestinal-like n=1 Tax=Anneissia japonica TaxID=1529436 RepID=UPI0014258E95|nr:fatty acid-binding protein, intestinal-like [Anneissia japonica]
MKKVASYYEVIKHKQSINHNEFHSFFILDHSRPTPRSAHYFSLQNRLNFKMPADFSGTWKFVKGENLTTLLDKLNVPADKRPSQEGSTVTISQSGDSFSIKTTTAAGDRNVSFSIGTSFVDPDIKALRGKELSVTPAWDGAKLVLKGEKGNGVTRELVGGQMVVTFEFDGVSAKRYFAKA